MATNGDDAASRARLPRELLAVARPSADRDRKTTLFEALNVLDSECPHSDYLAWLLDPAGPLDDGWLLRRLLTHAKIDPPPDGVPRVEREVWLKNGRLDIRVQWDAFTLAIENKVWSNEGDRQIARYLDGADISSSVVGRVLYLTPRGTWPASVDRGDPRVVTMSYGELAELLTAGLEALPLPAGRARVFAAEYRDGLYRLLRTRSDMTKPPQLSESTAIYLHNARRIAAAQNLAIRESSELIVWFRAAMKARLRPILGDGVASHDGRYVTIVHRPQWRRGDTVFGFYLGFEVDPKRRVFTEADDGPYAGVAAWRADDDESSKADWSESERVAHELGPILRPTWQHDDVFITPNDSDEVAAFWREVRPEEDADLIGWADGLLDLFAEMAATLAGPIDAFAARSGTR